MRILLFSTALIFAANMFSQELHCGATDIQNKWFAEHPDLKANFDKLQQEASARDKARVLNNYQQRTTSEASYTIPIVFHVLHTGGPENISDDQVRDAVRILNRDFRKQNADTNDVVQAFKNIIGDAKVTFTLATKDPQGNCTNGIVKHYDSRTVWDSQETSYYAYTWPPTRYLNIYVVKSINSNAAGYTYLPGSGIFASMDCIVILSTYVGSIGTGQNYLSRALTHEVGHWLDLPHVWGGTNNPGVSCGDDGVSDTPITEGFTNCNLNNSDICTNGVPENMQNYMDYSYCCRMFTNGQASRMQDALDSPVSGRNNLSAPNNLFITGVTDQLTTCIPMLDLIAPSSSVCVGKSLNITTFTSNATPTNYQWTGSNGVVFSNANSMNPLITLNTAGQATITCNASNANGSAIKSVVVNVIQDANNVTATYDESFESVAMPSNWTVINPSTPVVAWQKTSEAARFGTSSVFVNGEESPPNQTEILESPSYNFKANPNAQFTFYYAYARYNSANKDRFKVMASKDCGGTWVDVWTPTNQQMALLSAGTTTALLVPGTSDWALYNVTQDSPFFYYQDEANVRFRFSFTEDVGGVGYGNRMYLDNVQFMVPVGINEITKAIDFNVYPNPSNSAFNIGFTLSDPANIHYQVTTVSGAVVLNGSEQQLSAGSHEIRVNENNQLAKGIYFLNFEMNGIKLNKKLIVN